MLSKVIQGYPDYAITSCGKVVSHKRKQPKQIATWLNTDGYECVALWQGGKRHVHSVHRLVAVAFLPNEEGLPEVNHKDKIRSNNEVTNLEWSTRADNIIYSHAKGYTLVDPKGNWYKVTNLKEFARKHNVCPSSLYNVANGKRKHHKGWLVTQD